MNPPTTITRTIGKNRDKPRLWLEGKSLTAQDWHQGTLFYAEFQPGRITYTRLHCGHPLPEGQHQRKVAGTTDRPIIDTNTDKITAALGVPIGHLATVTITHDIITITA